MIDYTQPEPVTSAEQGNTGWLARVTWRCPGETPVVLDPIGVHAHWWMPNPNGQFSQLTNNGTTIDGSWVSSEDGVTVTQTYKFTRVDN